LADTFKSYIFLFFLVWFEKNDKACTPDILTMAKLLANGVPIGGIMTTDKLLK
jgi:acetylornithine/succinyldiaminopimelate/putrescine aminotransferase